MTGTWIKISDQVTEHPDMLELSPYAWTLWIHGLTYSSRNLTDGFIPKAMLPRLSGLRSPFKAAEELVEAGCWTVTENGWEVVNYAKHQRTKAQVEADRESAAARQRKHRAKKQDVTPLSHRDKRVSHASVTPLESETVSESSSSLALNQESYPQNPPDEEEDDHETALNQRISAVAEILGCHDWETAKARGRPIDNHQAYRNRCIQQRFSDPEVRRACQVAPPGLEPDLIAAQIIAAERTTPAGSSSSGPPRHLPGTGHLETEGDILDRWEETPSGLKRRKATA